MKKLIALAMMAAMLLSCLTACDLSNTDDEQEPEIQMIAVICPPADQVSYLPQIVDKLEEMKTAAVYPMDYTVTECADDDAWIEAIQTKSEEGCAMIMAVGSQGIDPLDEIAGQFPETQYVILDAVCDNENVRSYAFRSQETAYLIGIAAASIGVDTEQPHGPFGAVCTAAGQESFPWRWGYMEGARSVTTDLQMDDFLFNYTKSDNDHATAKELALRQVSRGCLFIAADCGAANTGIFQAASEAGFYTSGQNSTDVDGRNPHIIISQVKYADIVAERAVEEFFENGIQSGVVSLGLKEDVIDVIAAVDDDSVSEDPDSEDSVLTDEIIARVCEARDKIKRGDLTLEAPLEEDYSF